MNKISKNALIFFANLAIPANYKINKGLGDLLEFNNQNDDFSPKKFVIKNNNFLIKISSLINSNISSYEDFLKKINEEVDSPQLKYFLEEFRVFAIKNYFSNKYVIKKMKLIENFKYDKIDKNKDQLILNSLIDNDS